MMNWKDVRDLLNTEAEALRFTPAPEVVRLFQHQIVPSGMGTAGQAFTTMVFAQGDLRALFSYNTLCLARLVDRPTFTLEALKEMYHEYVPMSAEFLYTCGLERVWDLTKMVMAALDTLKTKAEFKELIDANVYYLSVVAGWVHILFPWYIGELFPQQKPEKVKEAARFLGLAEIAK
jgi:hypothetical protein